MRPGLRSDPDTALRPGEGRPLKCENATCRRHESDEQAKHAPRRKVGPEKKTSRHSSLVSKNRWAAAQLPHRDHPRKFRSSFPGFAFPAYPLAISADGIRL